MEIVDSLQDMEVLHQTYNLYYTNGMIRSWLDLVKLLEKDLRGSVTYFDDNDKNQKILKNNVAEALQKFEESAIIQLRKDLADFARVENSYYINTYKEVLDPFELEVEEEDSEKVVNAIEQEKINFSDNRVFTLLLFYRTFFNDNSKRIKDAIASAIMLDRDEKYIRDVLLGVNGQTQITAHRLSVVGRTLTNYYSAKVKNRFISKNRHMIQGYQWMSVLDSRTSTFCRWADGKTWNYDTNSGTLTAPYEPPAHENCRSSTTPIFYSYDKLGLDARYKEQFTGKPPERITYYEWLSRQPASLQKDVLGPTRYTLWKKEGVTPEKFYDNKGKFLTLSELQKKNVEIPKQYLQWVR
jgi:SPP1 gp7 family putative phage head morphogenesis protein